ncbi:lysophospholipase L1-like esterase [Paenarthrobacter nicotinovorans]|uniref:SGNH/GDSL hydrolase family protein n=1 Tax=Paenarthrobacter nicotinovorans TaxID=29320 RepID=UPI002789597B|nr:SGNH/GDSL hydrolase family protein [Paenarthrobacter nicotinovorans]MDP9936307.1 lysophospholipase L1-like esterase [Paenarthrobacter nicotinovorans]
MGTPKRTQNRKSLSILALAVLAILAIGASAFAYLRPAPAPAPTIDMAKAKQVQEEFEEKQAAEAAAILAANAPLTVQRPAERPLSVLFAGDSITVGRDASSEEASFRGLVAAKLLAGGPVNSKRIGDSGKTVAEVFPEMEATATASDMVIVELGTNDVYKNTQIQFAEDYPAFLASARKSSPNAALICVGVWQSSPSATSMNAVIESECAAKGGRFVSISTLHANPAMRSSPGVPHFAGGKTDGAHPNDLGHSEIATEILGKFTLRG